MNILLTLRTIIQDQIDLVPVQSYASCLRDNRKVLPRDVACPFMIENVEEQLYVLVRAAHIHGISDQFQELFKLDHV